MPEHRPWRGRSRGGGLGTALVAWMARLGGRDLCYGFILPPALWYYLRDRAARHAILAYWRRLRPGLRGPVRHVVGIIHFWTFARALADRLLMAVAPGALRYEQVGRHHLEAGMAHPQGCILLSAHLGSFELAARWLAPLSTTRLNLVMLDAEDPRVQAQLLRSMGQRPYGVIDLADPIAASWQIVAALQRGETCCMLGDRSAGDPAQTIAVDFVGKPARFPLGPFLAAAATGALIVPTFCVRSGWRSWTCRAYAPWRIPSLSCLPRPLRRAQLKTHIARWATLLAQQLAHHPWQWNNYYDFWSNRS